MYIEIKSNKQVILACKMRKFDILIEANSSFAILDYGNALDTVRWDVQQQNILLINQLINQFH